ncbi:MAG: hypothetical protein ACHQK9_19690 [Reyranellales bacterium]
MPNTKPAIVAGPVLVALALSFGLAACATTPTRWEKPGVPDVQIAQDMSDCRATAQQEAARLYPYGYGPPLTGSFADYSFLEWQMRIDARRAVAAERFVGLCLLNKGYARAPTGKK